jgi:hypothetical protein
MTTTRTKLDHRIGADGLFALRLRDGAVRLRGVDGDTVRVTADIDLEAAFQVDRGAGSLSLRAAHGYGRVRLPDHGLEVELPRGATVVVEGTSAEFSGVGLAGDQRYQTVSGDITLSAVAGTVVIQAVSGDVSLVADGELDIQARTVSGDLEVRAGRIARLSAGTTSGDVRIAGELAAGVAHRIETVSGDMLVAPAGGIRLEATTVVGDIRSAVPHRTEGGRGRRVLIIGDGKATLETRSMSGDVRIVEARNLRPDPPVAPEPPVAPPPPPPPVSPPRAARADTPGGPPPTGSSTAIAAAYDEERLRILRALERGEIDVDEAGRRLEMLDAGDLAEER